MSENNPFEILVQQKMEGFRVEPAPSDWQAIYDRLHPRNKRRIIWWWLPLAAILGAGIFWVYDKNVNINPPAALDVAKPAVVTDKNSPGQLDDRNSPVEQNVIPSDKQLPDREHINNPAQKGVTETSITHASGKNTSPAKKERSLKTLTSETSNINTNQAIIPVSHSAPLADNNDAAKSSASKTLETSSASAEEKKLNDDSPLPPTEKNPADEKSPAVSEENKAAEEKPSVTNEVNTVPETAATIPVKENIRRWQWGAYLGAGPNYPSDPLSLGPTALASSAPDYSSGNARTYTTSSNDNGWHFNAGIMAEKKLGKNWMFSTGIGVNTNTWKTTIEKYKDSIFNSSLQSRNKLYSEQQNYQLWMAEIPLQFSNRIAGKKAGSLWWTIGLNNQFTFSLTQQVEADSLQGSQLSDSRSLTSSSRFYQPQLRLGLMYNHDGKVHWQLLPLFQYTLTSVYSTNPPENPLLLNLQLQYRLFFQGKKSAKHLKK